MPATSKFPRQKLTLSQKNKKWRKECVDWADTRTYTWDSGIRKSYRNKRINYQLYDGVLDMEDLSLILNPNEDVGTYVPDTIQHYPIINNPINVLVGEESERRYEFQVRVSNLDAISEKEKSVVQKLRQNLISNIRENSEDEETYLKKVEEMSTYFKYEYQDLRELRANYLTNHYMKELNMKLVFNQGFKDVLIAGEEIYQFDIRGGDVTFEKLNPRRVKVLRNGQSSKVEDADAIVIDDYWSPGKIIDVYYDQLKDKDIERIEEYSQGSSSDDMGNEDERDFYLNTDTYSDPASSVNSVLSSFNGELGADYFGNFTDSNGNIRVLKVYWKSYRKIKRVKSYNPITGEPEYNIYSEQYTPNKELGEEVKTYWITEAWEGTKIGSDIYVNMRPRPVQYNRMMTPSKCHFGIIGQIYSTNNGKAVSLLDRMKPSSYLYDVVKNKLNESIAANYGKIMELDLAKIPDNWEVDKWLYFAKKDKIAVVDSFKEGNKGAATGKLAGGFNTTGRQLDLSQGNDIQMYISLLEYLEQSIKDYSGISPQRQGAISNRETVGGVERSVVQSSFITQELFAVHNNVKKRCIETLLETAKVALRGKNKKLQYISDDYANMIFDIPGDEFAECDYGVIVDDDISAAELAQKIDSLAQAGLQNQLVSFSTIMHMVKGSSLSTVLRLIESDEKESKEREAKANQDAMAVQQNEIAKKDALENRKLDIDEMNNIRDNQTDLEKTRMTIAAKGIEVEDNTTEDNLKQQKQNHDIKVANEKLLLDKTKQAEVERSNRAKEAISKTKQTKTN